VTDREPPLRFQRRELAEVIFEAVALGLAVPAVILLLTMGYMRTYRAALFIGAGFVIGAIVAGWRLRQVHSVVLEPGGRVVFDAVIGRRTVRADEIEAVDEVETGVADTVLAFRLRPRGAVWLRDCEQFRMAAKYLKERHPRLDYRLRKEMTYK